MPKPLITVQLAKDDIVLPMEGRQRRFFVAGQPVKVRSTSYVRRRIADGDLVVVEPEPAPKPKRSAPSTPKKSEE